MRYFNGYFDKKTDSSDQRLNQYLTVAAGKIKRIKTNKKFQSFDAEHLNCVRCWRVDGTFAKHPSTQAFKAFEVHSIRMCVSDQRPSQCSYHR